MKVTIDDIGDYVCEHGTALDMHCCNCHSGFIFDLDHECPDEEMTPHMFNISAGEIPRPAPRPDARCPGYRRSDYGRAPTCKYCGVPENEHVKSKA